MKFLSKAKEDFKINPITSEDMTAFVNRCLTIYQGKPPWLDSEEHIKTINFAKSICSETARLATLAISIKITGSKRAEWLQEQIDDAYYQIRDWVEYGCASGTVILKPSLDGIDVMTPDRFAVTNQRNGKITGAVFADSVPDETGERFYTRLEYHRFLDDGIYAVSNRCYIGNSEYDTSKPVKIGFTPWKGLLEDVYIENIKTPLFGVFKTPQANNINFNSPLGMPIFADAVQELKDLDIAYSRNAKEIFDSKRNLIVFGTKFLYIEDLADGLFHHQLFDGTGVRLITVVESDGDFLTVFLFGTADAFNAFTIHGHRFFGENFQAGGKSHFNKFSMLAIRNCDDDGIRFGFIEHFVPVGIHGDVGFEQIVESLHTGGIGIVKSDEISVILNLIEHSFGKTQTTDTGSGDDNTTFHR